MQAWRTTLILGASWLLIFLFVGYQVHFRMHAQQKDLQGIEGKVKQELADQEILVATLPGVQEVLEQVKYLWTYRSKAIPRQETSHATYDYLDQILAQQKTTLNFDYFAAEVGDTNGVRSSNYHLVGEAKFVDLYRFIWYIEHLPRYLRLNTLQLSELPGEKAEAANVRTGHWVRFDLNFTALSAQREGFGEIQYAAEIAAPEECYDPFKPPEKIVVSVPENLLGLPNVFESALKAMTPTQIYLLDQKGELKVLALGDEVYLGRLVDINVDENRAIFDLDQIIPSRQVSLVIQLKK